MNVTKFESALWDIADWFESQSDGVKFFIELFGTLALATIIGLMCYIKL